MDAARARKLGGRIAQIVAEMLERRIKDPRLGFVTVTEARLTNDLREATVFYTVYGSAEERDGTAAALASAVGVIRSEVGRQTGLRHTPSLEFRPDTVPDNARNIEELVARAREADAALAAAARVPSLQATRTVPQGRDPDPDPDPDPAESGPAGAGSADLAAGARHAAPGRRAERAGSARPAGRPHPEDDRLAETRGTRRAWRGILAVVTAEHAQVRGDAALPRPISDGHAGELPPNLAGLLPDAARAGPGGVLGQRG